MGTVDICIMALWLNEIYTHNRKLWFVGKCIEKQISYSKKMKLYRLVGLDGLYGMVGLVGLVGLYG